MTAGIGILNKNGAVLAADSFGSVFMSNKQKIVTVDNIFRLSQKHSVGIMISVTSKFMHIPWETIIKVYVSYVGDKTFDTLREYADDFIKFLSSDKRFISTQIETEVIQNALSSCIKEVYGQAQINGDYKKALNKEIDNKLAFYLKEKFLYGLDDSFIKSFIETYSKKLEIYIENQFKGYDFDINEKQNLIKICAYVISKSNYIIDNYEYTGLTVVGYGNEEIFPCSYSYNIYMLVSERLIYDFRFSNNIRYNLEGKSIIFAFGEQDEAWSYIYGINPNLKQKIFMEIENGFEDLLKKVQDKYNKSSKNGYLPDKEKEMLDDIGKLVKDIPVQLKGKIDNHIDTKYKSSFFDVLEMLNKKEMADLAESLININMSKHRFSAEEQIVGGAIDIAIITKGDGFLWVKKKQLYNTEFNLNDG